MTWCVRDGRYLCAAREMGHQNSPMKGCSGLEIYTVSDLTLVVVNWLRSLVYRQRRLAAY